MSEKGKNSPTIGENGFLANRDEVSLMLSSVNALSKLPKVETDEELQDRINWYFDDCIKNGVRPGVEQMALACGVDRRTLWDWEVGNSMVSSKRGEIVREAKQRLASFHEQLMLYGKINPVTAIFIAKNNYHYTDRTELEVIPHNNPNDPTVPVDDIKKLLQDQHDASYVVDSDPDGTE